MRGGAPLDMAEMERVSSLFDVEKIGGAVTGGLQDGERIVSGPMGEVASLREIQELTVNRQQIGGRQRSSQFGGRNKRRKTRGKSRRRKPRFRLNLRASIRLRA